jgi:uncharacterized protein (DUF2344 family)
MLKNLLSKRSYWHQAYNSHVQILSTFMGNPFFMEAQIKNHLNLSNFKEIDEQQLKQTLNDVFLNKNTAKYIEALDQKLFNIKDLALCTPEQRSNYLQQLNNNKTIKLSEMIEKSPPFDIDEIIARFTRPKP